jgi:hypothetical protein
VETTGSVIRIKLFSPSSTKSSTPETVTINKDERKEIKNRKLNKRAILDHIQRKRSKRGALTFSLLLPFVFVPDHVASRQGDLIRTSVGDEKKNRTGNIGA